MVFAARTVVAADPPAGDARAMVREGVRLHDAGHYDEAIAKYREALAVDPGSVDAAYEIAHTQFTLENGDSHPFRARAGNRWLSPISGTPVRSLRDVGGSSPPTVRDKIPPEPGRIPPGEGSHMAKGLWSLLGLLLLLPAGAVAAGKTRVGDAKSLIEEGVRLHDAGKYDEAIAKYRQALAVEPGNPTAIYEIGYALFQTGKFRECIDEVEPHLDRVGRLKPIYYVLLGNCTDLAGKPKNATKIFEKGIEEFPEDTGIAFNAAITRARQEEWNEARQLLKRTIELDPLHRSAHLNLGVAFATQGYRVQAILALLRFVSLEPEGPRAVEAARRVLALLEVGFEQTGENDSTITIDPDAPQDEGDYSSADLIRALGAAVVTTEDWKDKSEGKKLVYRIDAIVGTIEEAPKGDGPGDFTRRTYLPFALALREAALLEAFVHRAFAPVGPPELAEWVERHPESMALLDGFLASESRR